MNYMEVFEGICWYIILFKNFFDYQLHFHRALGVSQVALVVKNSPANAEDVKRHGFDLWVGQISWRRAWQPTPVFLPGESQV